MRTHQLEEFAKTTAGEWVLGCVAVAFVLFVLLGSVALIVQAVGDSWAEMCVSQGGEFVVNEEIVPTDTGNWTTDQRCDLP